MEPRGLSPSLQGPVTFQIIIMIHSNLMFTAMA